MSRAFDKSIQSKKQKEDAIMKEITRKNIAGIWSAMPTPFTNELELAQLPRVKKSEKNFRLKILFF